MGQVTFPGWSVFLYMKNLKCAHARVFLRFGEASDVEFWLWASEKLLTDSNHQMGLILHKHPQKETEKRNAFKVNDSTKQAALKS